MFVPLYRLISAAVVVGILLAFPVLGALSGSVSVSVKVADEIGPLADQDEDGIRDAWEFEYFFNLTTVDESTDFDMDGFPDLHECLAGTHPRDPNSALQITDVRLLANGRLELTWDSSTNTVPALRSYDIYWASSLSNLATGGTPISVNIPTSGESTLLEYEPESGDLLYFRVNLHQ